MTDTHTMATAINEASDGSTELVPPTDPRACFVSIDVERLGGVPCFVRTRVPVKYLWEYLLKGQTLFSWLTVCHALSGARYLGTTSARQEKWAGRL
jgi:hypothetical protein